MLTRLSLRKSLPLLLGIFGLMFTVLLTTWHLPTRIEETLTDWRDHTAQHLALLQSSLSDHRRLGRNAELETELADLASLEGVRWAMVIGPDLQIIATTRLGLTAERLGADRRRRAQGPCRQRSPRLGRRRRATAGDLPAGPCRTEWHAGARSAAGRIRLHADARADQT